MTLRLTLIMPLALAATPAAAGQLASSPYDYRYSNKESDRAFAEYGQCVIRRSENREKALSFLKLVPYTPEWLQAGRKLSVPECLTGLGQVRMSFSAVALRPALFAALYRREFAATAPASFDAVPSLRLADMYTGPVERFPPDVLAQLGFGNCVVRGNPAAARQLIMARPWSAEEDAALPALKDAMARCLKEGQQIKLNRPSVRGVLAEALYHLSSAHAAAAASTPNVATGSR